MQMVRFKQDIKDDDSIIWRKGFIYKILYENNDHFILDNDSLAETPYGISKEDLNKSYIKYPCQGIINSECTYCKWVFNDTEKGEYCGLNKYMKKG